ncbi:MAG TPA: hypothetical protein VFP89_12850 [Propionibacteriaceae bacterium]|nr:hypothetical protein [Propionibacteriaceae bacterium]
MTLEPIEELRVPFDPSPAEQKVLRWRRLLRGRVVGFVLTCAILVGLYLWRGDEMAGPGLVVVYAVVIGTSLIWLLIYLVVYRRAKKFASDVGTGTALCIDRYGVEVTGVRVPWSELAGIAAVRGGPGRAPRLEVRPVTGEPLSVSFDHMDVRPATLDLTARAYSGGRHGVDLQALDN